jgi:hypothetical protein
MNIGTVPSTPNARPFRATDTLRLNDLPKSNSALSSNVEPPTSNFQQSLFVFYLPGVGQALLSFSSLSLASLFVFCLPKAGLALPFIGSLGCLFLSLASLLHARHVCFQHLSASFAKKGT